MSIRTAWEPLVPPRYRKATDWDRFAAACILYDPPELKLEEFAEYGGLTPEGMDPAGEEHEGGDEGLRVLAPPIARVKDPGQLSEAWYKFFHGVIDELGRRYFAPDGEDVWRWVSDIYRDTDLLDKLTARTRAAETHPYIAVGQDTTDGEIEDAVQMIRATRVKNVGGAPPYDKLVAIKCAALYDDHNGGDPEDGRGKRWSYAKLGKEYGPRATAKRYKAPQRVGKELVKLGREFREERKKRKG